MKVFIEQTDERLFSGWATIIWRAVEKNVRRLQERIYRATERQAWRQVRSLQKLLARSTSNIKVALMLHITGKPYTLIVIISSTNDGVITTHGLSRLRGNSLLGGGGLATAPCYPTLRRLCGSKEMGYYGEHCRPAIA